MTSLKTSIKTITYLSDIGCLEIHGASLRSASILKNRRVVFNIKGNDYRLIVAIAYQRGWMFIKFIGTHKEYDKIDAETVSLE